MSEKGGGLDSSKDPTQALDNRAFIECLNPDCGFNLRPFLFDGIKQLKCDKCLFQSTVDEYNLMKGKREK